MRRPPFLIAELAIRTHVYCLRGSDSYTCEKIVAIVRVEAAIREQNKATCDAKATDWNGQLPTIRKLVMAICTLDMTISRAKDG